MRTLLIDKKVRANIKGLMAAASAKPTPVNRVMSEALQDKDIIDVKLSDWRPGQRGNLAPYIVIPQGYRVAYSIEEQPIGMCAHLSVSVDKRGKLPSITSIEAIAFEFNINMKTDKLTVWLEEFEPGWSAVNIVCLMESKPRGGTA